MLGRKIPTMPRYFFHIRTADGQLIRDDDGVELTNLDEAGCEAAEAAKGFETDRKRGGLDYSGCHFEIVSADGRETLTAPAFVRPLQAV